MASCKGTNTSDMVMVFVRHQQSVKIISTQADFIESAVDFASGNSGDTLQIPLSLLVHASNDELESARQTYLDWDETQDIGLVDQLIVAAVLGNRTDANRIAADIDARAGGNLVLMDIITSCFCGAPFDLNATPNFKARIEEAGISWPPASPITYPAKDW